MTWISDGGPLPPGTPSALGTPAPLDSPGRTFTQARALGKALFAAAFGKGHDISKAETVIEIAADQSVDREALATALQDQAVKDRLRHEVDQAIEAGVFGSPILIVDGEPFWGHDHLHDVERWLDSGGW